MTKSELRARIEQQLADVTGLQPGESMYGHGLAFWANVKEVVHFEHDNVIEIRLTRPLIRDRRQQLKADGRVQLRPHGGDWMSIRYDVDEDVGFVIALATLASEAHQPPPGVPAKPPPTGPDLARRKRFH